MKNIRDLNKLSQKFIREKSPSSIRKSDAKNFSYRALQNHSATSTSAKVTTYFDGIERLFVELSERHEVVVGAVAWLTNTQILSALAKSPRVAITVQKEDFLRKDIGFPNYSQQRLKIRSLYNNLTPFDAGDFTESYPGQQEFHPQYNSTVQSWLFDNRGNYYHGGDAVRCMGFANDPNAHQIPRMHHKFLIFGERDEGLVMWPKCVVTGSFNLSHNAVKSRENVVLIEDTDICQSYLSEWAQLWSMSEPLDWSSPEPSQDEMYVGT